jgi:hypothetical protein
MVKLIQCEIWVCFFLTKSIIREDIFDNAQCISFSISNRFLCFLFICKSVEKPDSQRYVDTNGINARKANKIIVISSKIYSPRFVSKFSPGENFPPVGNNWYRHYIARLRFTRLYNKYNAPRTIHLVYLCAN